MKFEAARNPGLSLVHLYAAGTIRTICKHYYVPKMEAVNDLDKSEDPLCTDCQTAVIAAFRKEQDGSV
jgi:hypothetical protein